MAQIDKPGLHFNTKLYSGNNSTNAITGVGFRPDWTWLKPRDSADNHRLMDAVNSGTYLVSNDNRVEASTGSNFASFDTDGFTLGGSDTGWNGSSNNYVSWNWKAANSSGSTNNDGSIASTVSVNSTAGFSIVTWSSTTNATVGHGLGAKPDMVITKSTNNATNWATWHKNLTGGNEQDRYVNLNTTAADDTYTNYWGTGGFTPSVFGVSNNSFHNNIGNMVAYCFRSIPGYSKFGGYTGNDNVDGAFVYTGFKPAFVMIKRTDDTDNWYIYDNKRDGYNVDNDDLHPNTTDTESTDDKIDLLSNGFKLRVANNDVNGNQDTYIYMAIAENPIVGSNNIPAVAR